MTTTENTQRPTSLDLFLALIDEYESFSTATLRDALDSDNLDEVQRERIGAYLDYLEATAPVTPTPNGFVFVFAATS